MYTVDTSVWVNSSDTLEAGYAISRQFVQALQVRNLPVIVPTLVLAEVAGAISRTRQDATLGETFAQRLAALPNVTLIALDEASARQALALAALHRLRGADSVYGVVASVYGCTLVSLDNEHLTRLQGIVPVQTPAEALAALSSSP